MTDERDAPAPPLPPADLSPTRIRTAIRDGRLAEVLLSLAEVPPGRRAELFVQLRLPRQREILAAAAPELAASILAECDSGSLPPVLEGADLQTLASAFRLVPPDNLADIVLHLPKDLAGRVLDLLDEPLRQDVGKLLTFDPETAGGLMTPRYLSVPDVVTVGHALELLRGAGKADSPSYLYAVDAMGRLTGVLPLRSLLMANARQPIAAIMVREVKGVKASAHRDELVDLFNQHRFVSLPVVDDKDRLIGIVTSGDVMAAMRRGEEQVVQGVTGADPRERLLQTLAATRGRLPWISVTIVAGLGCAAIAQLFERTLTELVVLGIFIPVVLAVGESIGAQTTSVVLSTVGRAGWTREELTDFLLKEVLVGILIALYAGLLLGATSYFWHGHARLGVLIGGAVLASVTWAAVLGVAIPGAMRRLRVNPAIASGPLVLALADLSTLAIYFGGAALLMTWVKPS